MRYVELFRAGTLVAYIHMSNDGVIRMPKGRRYTVRYSLSTAMETVPDMTHVGRTEEGTYHG